MFCNLLYRDNIQELDTIHKSLQVKLGEIESTAPFCQYSKIPSTHSKTPSVNPKSTAEHSIRVCSELKVSESGGTEERTLLDNTIPGTLNLPSKDLHISPSLPHTVPLTNPSPEIDPLSMTTQSPSDVSKEENLLSNEVTHCNSSDHQSESEHSQLSQESIHRQESQSKDGLPLSSSQSLGELEQEIEMHPEDSLDVNDNISYSLTDVSLTSEDTESCKSSRVCVPDNESKNDKDDGRLHGETLNCHQTVSSPPITSVTSRPSVGEHMVDTAQLKGVSPPDIEALPLSSTSRISPMPTSVTVSTPNTRDTFVSTVSTTNDTIPVSQASSNDVPHSSEMFQLPQQSTSTAASIATPTVTSFGTRAAASSLDSDVKPIYESRNSQDSRFHQLPNFFMPPEELEESMRRLRASALTRPPPRTRQVIEKENRTVKSTDIRTPYEPKSTLHDGTGNTRTLRTLQEAHKYLDTRRGQRSPVSVLPQDVSALETQRIARIFSSRPTNLTKS